MQWRSKAADARIVHQDIGAPMGFINVSGGSLDGAQISNIARQYFRLPAISANLASPRFQRLPLATAEDDHCAQSRQFARNRRPNAAARARYNRYLLMQRIKIRFTHGHSPQRSCQWSRPSGSPDFRILQKGQVRIEKQTCLRRSTSL